MITKDQYNQLVEKIVEAVPEIMELEFGCRIKTLGGIRIVVTAWPYDEEWLTILEGIGQPMLLTKQMIASNRTLKIIGRPIQLADVMRAINSLGDTKKTYAISQEGKFFSIRYIPALLDYEVKYYSKWDLSLPLDLQSDEVKEFLYNLIVK